MMVSRERMPRRFLGAFASKSSKLPCLDVLAAAPWERLFDMMHDVAELQHGCKGLGVVTASKRTWNRASKDGNANC